MVDANEQTTLAVLGLVFAVLALVVVTGAIVYTTVKNTRWCCCYGYYAPTRRSYEMMPASI